MSIYQIPVAKTGTSYEINSDSLAEATYKAVFQAGLKHYAEVGLASITKTKYASEAEFLAAAKTKVEENIEKIKTGKLRVIGAKAAKGDTGVLGTEMLRIAKVVAKDMAKAQGIKISHTSAKAWTEAGKALIASDPERFRKAAEESLARAKGIEAVESFDIRTIVHADPAKVAKAEAKKAAKAEAKAGKAPPVKAKKGAEARAAH